MFQPCQALTENQDRGEFISFEQAKIKLNDYLEGAGHIQPSKTDEEHVYGHLFGLNSIKELLMKIDKYNIGTRNPDEQITAVRIYRSKTPKDGALLNDLLIVPVKRTGNDYPQSLTAGNGDGMILANAGPCPNVCNKTFFTSAQAV